MNTFRLFSLFALTLILTTLTSCEVVGDIFKAGAWVGIIGVFVVVALIWWIVSKIGGGGSAS